MDQSNPASPLKAERGRPHWLRVLETVPDAILPVLPSATCPFCLAAYAGVFSSFGLGFLFNDRVQRPLILVFLGITVVSMFWTARHHRKPGPIMAALLGSVAIIAGRIVWTLPWSVYPGVVCVVAAAIWNLLLRRPRTQFVQIRVESHEQRVS